MTSPTLHAGHCTLIADLDESAKRIRKSIRALRGKDVAVVISDTEWKLDKFGTIDIAIGCSGIQPISRNFGAKISTVSQSSAELTI